MNVTAFQILVLAAVSAAGCWGGEPTVKKPSALDARISFLESRVARDPMDYKTPVALGMAYLEKARLSGDGTFYSRSEKQFEAALKIKPGDAAALSALAAVKGARHDFAGAIKLADDVLRLNPGEAFALGVKGDALLSLGRMSEAAAEYLKLKKLTEGTFYFTREANLCYFKGDLSGTLNALRSALEVAPASLPSEVALCHLQLSGHYLGIGSLKLAEDHLKAALELAPDSNAVLERLAELRAVEQKFPEAFELYERIVKEPVSPHVWQALGDLHVTAKNPAEAAKWHKKALDGYLASVNSGDHHYLRPLAMYYADTDPQPAEAVKWALKDFEVRKDVFAYDVLAWAQFKNGDFKTAAATIEKALEFGTRDAHLYFHAGMIFSRNGDFARGKAMMTEAFKINPVFDRFHTHR